MTLYRFHAPVRLPDVDGHEVHAVENSVGAYDDTHGDAEMLVAFGILEPVDVTDLAPKGRPS